VDETALLHEKMLEANEALLLGSVRQHELTEAAGKLNDQLRVEIAERRRIESELNAAIAVAEKANLAKSDFLSSMSHELRTPLNAILGFAQLIESGSPPPTTSQKRSVEQILKAGWYLLELINEILDLALIESGKLPLSLEPISLTEVVHECQVMIGPQAQKRGIRLVFPQVEVPYFVNADRTRVKQVFINLLSNAVKYNKSGGTVEVDYTASTPGRIRINVKDTGEGLTPEKMTQLFQPFNRIGKETGVEEGTGIGLAVSKQLVELMGGVIGVESTVGKGSVFWFELNRTAEPQTALDPATITAVARTPVQADVRLRTLLYVEDNPPNLELVEQIIAHRPDLRLLSAADGNLGVELARTHQPEVILMDINLPGISGIEALKILRADPSTAHIPIVALTANALPRDIEEGLAAGFFNYLTKPLKIDKFMRVLEAALKFSQTPSRTAARAAKKDPA
jgi:signal transduction histidine kinase/CheY-like chemotaxis protein